jgi:hypothetical protein
MEIRKVEPIERASQILKEFPPKTSDEQSLEESKKQKQDVLPVDTVDISDEALRILEKNKKYESTYTRRKKNYYRQRHGS